MIHYTDDTLLNLCYNILDLPGIDQKTIDGIMYLMKESGAVKDDRYEEGYEDGYEDGKIDGRNGE